MKTGLLLVDIQNDYFPGGKMELVGMTEALARSKTLLDAFRDAGERTIHVQHQWENADAPFFVAGSDGAKIHESILPGEGDWVIGKDHPNSFHQTDLEAKLRDAGIGRLIVCGAMSHMCIDATVRAGADLGFECIVAENACATLDVTFGDRTVVAADVHGAFMSALGFAYAKIVTSDEAMIAI